MQLLKIKIKLLLEIKLQVTAYYILLHMVKISLSGS